MLRSIHAKVPDKLLPARWHHPLSIDTHTAERANKTAQRPPDPHSTSPVCLESSYNELPVKPRTALYSAPRCSVQIWRSLGLLLVSGMNKLHALTIV